MPSLRLKPKRAGRKTRPFCFLVWFSVDDEIAVGYKRGGIEAGNAVEFRHGLEAVSPPGAVLINLEQIIPRSVIHELDKLREYTRHRVVGRYQAGDVDDIVIACAEVG